MFNVDPKRGGMIMTADVTVEGTEGVYSKKKKKEKQEKSVANRVACSESSIGSTLSEFLRLRYRLLTHFLPDLATPRRNNSQAVYQQCKLTSKFLEELLHQLVAAKKAFGNNYKLMIYQFNDENGTFEQPSSPNEAALRVTDTHMQPIDPLVVQLVRGDRLINQTCTR